MKTSSCTEKKQYAYNNAPRCGARTKHNNGLPCRSPAVRGKKRCRIHGGGKGSGAQPGNTNALKHGCTTATTKKFKKMVKDVLRIIN
jgi:hypothetical protein